MNIWLTIILAIMLIGYCLDILVSTLNLRALSPNLPDEFKDIYDPAEYAKSQEYTRTTTRFSLISSSVTTIVTISFLLLGGFNVIDLLARSFDFGPIITGLIFTGLLALLSYLINLPFSIYSVFVIEERFGFNTTTPKTFILDIFKTFLLAIFLGAPILSLILWFFAFAGAMAWFYCWVAVVMFTFFIQLIAPVVILPLFNTFSPLDEGELKDKIFAYSKSQNFQLKGIFTMDGSKRSTKLNAFFTGFGKFRKIVFYDTLIQKLTTGEIIAVLAHEMGHFKLKHIPKMLVGSIVQTGILFFLISLVMENSELFAAFKMDNISVYASLFFFGFLYSPVNLLVSMIFHFFSRKHEFEADAYAARTSGRKNDLISGLKKLSQVNLSNLTPHPVTVLLHYTHPPVLERIRALREIDMD